MSNYNEVAVDLDDNGRPVQPVKPKRPVKRISFRFRGMVQQTSENEIDVEIPLGVGPSPVSKEFAQEWGLSAGEIEHATEAVLRSVVIVR